MKEKISNVTSDRRRFEHQGLWYFLEPAGMKGSWGVLEDISDEVKSHPAFKVEPFEQTSKKKKGDD